MIKGYMRVSTHEEAMSTNQAIVDAAKMEETADGQVVYATAEDLVEMTSRATKAENELATANSTIASLNEKIAKLEDKPAADATEQRTAREDEGAASDEDSPMAGLEDNPFYQQQQAIIKNAGDKGSDPFLNTPGRGDELKTEKRNS